MNSDERILGSVLECLFFSKLLSGISLLIDTALYQGVCYFKFEIVIKLQLLFSIQYLLKQ